MPGAPRWGLSLAYAALATAAVCWPAWPGMMSFDSLFAYRESLTGIETTLWPPMHAYLFWLSRSLGAGVWGLFLLQTFLVFLGGAVALNLLVRRRLWAMAGLAAFALWFVYTPELLGVAIVQWHDVTTTSFAVAGLAAWLVAARDRRPAGLVVAALSLGIAAALRYNTVLLLVLVAPLMVWRPYLAGPTPASARRLAAAMLALSLGLAFASTQWRLPDFRTLPPAHSFGGTQEFDLLGISACADRNYLPPRVTAGWPITPRQIRMAYDPRHLQRAYRPIPGAPRIFETDADGQVAKVWPRAVRREFGCYLAHRTAVFVQQMGLARAGVFYPTNAAIDPNPYGLAPAHPKALAKLDAYIQTRAPEPWRRPISLYLLAPLAVAVLWVRRAPARLLFAALVGGAFAYAAGLFVAAPAADARYIFPSSVVCAWVIAAGAAVFMDARRDRAS